MLLDQESEASRGITFWRYLSSFLGYSLRWTVWTSCLTSLPFLYLFNLNDAIIPWYEFPQPRNIPTGSSGYYTENKVSYFSFQHHQFWWPVIQVAATKGAKIWFIPKHICVFTLLCKHFLKDEKVKKQTLKSELSIPGSWSIFLSKNQWNWLGILMAS